MIDFWYLLSFIISATGFITVGTVSFLGGEDMLTVALKAIATFVVLWLSGSAMRSILTLAVVVASGGEEAGQQE